MLSLAVGDRLAFAFLPDGVLEAMSDLHFDAIVIGSGFGGSVAAFRLAEAGKSVCLLERGKPYPPGSFARSPRDLANNVWDPSSGRHGLFNIWSFNKLESIVSSGLGGGSLIYANVLLRKDEHWFRQKRPDGAGDESWPITRKDLDPHYAEVERMMNVQKFPFGKPGYEGVSKTQAMKDAADIMGLTWDLPNLAITFANQGKVPVPSEQIANGPYPNLHGRPRKTCRLCGECDLGCNDGSKNTLDHTYLSAAASHGADIRTRSEVRLITPTAGGYEIAYVEHLPENEGRATPTQRLQLKRLTTKKVILAAGTYGSTYLLLKNANALAGLGPAMGTRFSGNGDVLAFALNAIRGGVPRWLKPSNGPVITSYIRAPDFFDSPAGSSHGHYVEDAGYPVFAEWLAEASQVPGLLSRVKFFLWRAISRALGLSSATDISGEIGRLVGQGRLSASSLPLLGMGRDRPDGVLSLNGNNLANSWSDAGSRDYFAGISKTMKAISDVWGADFVESPLGLLGRQVTVHPLGGCPMGETIAQGVVSPWGESFGHPSLYVADGSVMPGPVGANPALTIAAFSNRMCDHMLGTWGTQGTSPVMPQATHSPPTQVQFSETMAGYISASDKDYMVSARAGERANEKLAVHLLIKMKDIDTFIRDPEHEGTASGSVECPMLGGMLPVKSGTFNLFAPSADPSTIEMRYRLFVIDKDNKPVTVTGFKTVRNDPGFDSWSDTTTLYTRVLQGHVGPAGQDAAPIIASGIIRITIPAFMKQLTTFKAHGPSRVAEAKALASFGKLFMGELWDTYSKSVVFGTGGEGEAL